MKAVRAVGRQPSAIGCERALLLVALCSSCYLPTKKVTLRIELPDELASRIAEVSVLPKIAEISRKSGAGLLQLELKREAGPVRLELPGACPLLIDTRVLPERVTAPQALQPLFDVGPAERVVGLGQHFELRAKPSCAEAKRARTSFFVVAGAPLDNGAIPADGRSFSATTRTTLPRRETGIIVPISAHEQRKLRTEVAFRMDFPDGQHVERRLGVSAVARSSGLPNVGLSHPVLLRGQGFSLLERPLGSQAELRPLGEVSELVPDVSGRYRLRQSRGHADDSDALELSIQSGRYDQTPLDCGRADCHAEIAKSAQNSPMTHVLASDLGGCHSLTDPACASACHTTGERGTSDGGFTHVASELALPGLPADYDDLPVALRRLGGVGCMACHGPTKIPERGARSAILSSAVCAVCHDAPPRYGHVAAFASTRMAHSNQAALGQDHGACARCHTSAGALGREGSAEGIACAVCHDVHPHGKARPSDSIGLLRDFPTPVTLSNPPASFQGPSRVCVSCHAPSSNTLRPEASAAAMVAAQGGLEPNTGVPLLSAAPHAANAKGCLSCHDSGPDGLIMGKSHGFRATAASCKACHASPKTRDATLAARAQELLRRLDPEHAVGNVSLPWHARYERLLPTPPQTRALRDVLLVLEDPAADVHNPVYAKALLDAAERLAPGATP